MQPIVTEYEVSQKFKPGLYFKTVDNLDGSVDTEDFPPNGDSGFDFRYVYNPQGFLQLTVQHNSSNANSGILMSLYGPLHKNEESRIPLDVNIFASSTKDILIVENQTYLEKIFDQERVLYMKLDDSFVKKEEGYTVVELTNCLGHHRASFVQDPRYPNDQVEGSHLWTKNGKHIV